MTGFIWEEKRKTIAELAFNIFILCSVCCRSFQRPSCDYFFFQSMFLSITIILLVVVVRTVTSVHCYECTDYVPCGINGQGSIVTNCPVCMVYQNQYDSSKSSETILMWWFSSNPFIDRIVRRCCWYNCGVDNSVGMYEGRRAYFCTSHLCNSQGAENTLTDSLGCAIKIFLWQILHAFVLLFYSY